MPRSIWFVDKVQRLATGKADYRWANSYADRPPGRRRMRTDICDQLGINYPIFGFTPSEHVAAAISRAGGLGVLGCVRFNDAGGARRASWTGWTRTPTASRTASTS